jgi:uncharacterized protein YdbL (DUF1318 family)
MTTKKKISLIALLLAIALPVSALDLDEARARGAIGERADGYVAAVKGDPSKEVKALVAEVNAKRRAHYEEIAKRNGAPVEAVAMLAGQKLVANAASGQYVDSGNGWVKKP